VMKELPTVRVSTKWERVRGPTGEVGRTCWVKEVSGPPWNTVTYRYSKPKADGYGKGHNRMCPRTNSVIMSIESFLKNFKPFDEPLTCHHPESCGVCHICQKQHPCPEHPAPTKEEP
jgi:hypothetical protein